MLMNYGMTPELLHAHPLRRAHLNSTLKSRPEACARGSQCTTTFRALRLRSGAYILHKIAVRRVRPPSSTRRRFLPSTATPGKPRLVIPDDRRADTGAQMDRKVIDTDVILASVSSRISIGGMEHELYL